ncbi:MAG: hypothetical protein ACP5LL_05315 [Thermoplasmata archaeon]
MRVKDGKRIILIIFSSISIFFLISGIISAMNYTDVLLYRNKVINENPSNVKAYYDRYNGTIYLNFSFKDPTPFSINFYSLTALFFIDNKTVATFQRSYYYYELYPLEIDPFKIKDISYAVKPDPGYINLILNSTHFNITIQIKVRFSGFSYYYQNPNENYSPERYYLTEMVMMEIDWSGIA